MSHRNARLTPRGRLILVERVLAGSPMAHVAKSMGVSRHCASRWVHRFRCEGVPGLEDRSSRPATSPRRTPAEVEEAIVAARRARRAGPGPLSHELGVPARTISRVLARRGEPHLAACDPLTGEVIRTSRVTALRYERPLAGDLVHVDVKKLGRIPAGGGWRAWGRAAAGDDREHKLARTGFDYVHSMVDDHSRLAYSEVLCDERADTCAQFLERAGAWFASLGVEIRAVITDNAFSYRHGRAWRETLAAMGARALFIKPHCPWQNGKVERFNRTLQVEWAYRRIYTSNEERSSALADWLRCYNYERPHSSLEGLPPISRVAST
jgi:transposase InsO family protein